MPLRTSEPGATPYLFLAPAVVLALVLLLGPILYNIGLSFYDSTMVSLVDGSDKMVGFSNYALLSRDMSFWHACVRLGVFSLTSTVIEIGVALAAAVYLDQIVRAPKWVEALLILPMFVLPVVSGLLFRYLFDPGDGLIGVVYGWFGAAAPGLLGDGLGAMLVILIQDVWRMGPFVFLIIYSGLKALPQEPLEAVKLDGAGVWQAFRWVQLPPLSGTIAVAAVLKLIESLKAFTEIYLMTGGGPGSATELLPLYIVKQAFVFFKFGYGAAISSVVLALGVAIGCGWLVLQRLLVAK